LSCPRAPKAHRDGHGKFVLVPPLPSVHAVKKSGVLLPKINPKFARGLLCISAPVCSLLSSESRARGRDRRRDGTLMLLGVTGSLGRREKLGMVLHPQPEQPMAFAGVERPAPLAALPQTGSLQHEWRRCGKQRSRTLSERTALSDALAERKDEE
jgi:hypothetical protein